MGRPFAIAATAALLLATPATAAEQWRTVESLATFAATDQGELIAARCAAVHSLATNERRCVEQARDDLGAMRRTYAAMSKVAPNVVTYVGPRLLDCANGATLRGVTDWSDVARCSRLVIAAAKAGTLN